MLSNLMDGSRRQDSLAGSLETRLRRIMLESGFRSIRGMAEGCGLAPATLSKRIQKERETGSAKVDGETIHKISKRTGFAAQWILTGEGSPYVNGEETRESVQYRPEHATRDRVDWGREVVEGLVQQGVSPSRARQAVGALLLQHDREYTSVIELYQASLEKLGYTHAPVEQSSVASKETSTQKKTRSTQSRSRSTKKRRVGD